MSTTTMAATLRPARLASSPKRLIRRLRHEERGVLDIELIGFVPILVLVTMFLVQGFLAVSTVTSVSAAARDGAAMLGRSPEQAAHEALPDWVRLESVSDGCGSGHCVQVTARVPIGIPAITTEHLTVTRTAYFPEG